MTKKVFVLITLVVLALFVLSFGCTTSNLGSVSSQDLSLLQEKYGVKDNFSPNLGVMNNYVSELSVLRARSSLGITNVLEAELNSAQAFYYFQKAISESQLITTEKDFCSSKEFIDVKNYIELSLNYSNKAVNLISSFNLEELSLLRTDQLEIVSQLKSDALNIQSDLKKRC